MRTYNEIYETAVDRIPFSNGTEISAWMENWCWRPCHNPAESAWQRYENGERKTPPKDFPGGCPLILCALEGRTPLEWLEQPRVDGLIDLADRYHCIEFRSPDDGPGGDPTPRPHRDPPNQLPLFDRPPPGTRMLVPEEQFEEVLV